MKNIIKSAGDLTLLDGLAQEAQYYSSTAVGSMLQLGRVLCQAKPLVKHGAWGAWIRENAGCSERTAQQFMQAYTRFGGNGAMTRIGDRSKLFKMLSLPEGAEDAFVEENDIASMTSREVDAAVRRVRAELQGQVDAARQHQQEAEQALRDMADRPPEFSADVQKRLCEQESLIAAQRIEIDRLAEMGSATMEETRRLRRENQSLQQDVAERDELLEEVQRECNRVQADLLNMQSAAAKGDAERVPADELTIDVFASAVRQFIGTCARLPHMRRTFSTMPMKQRDAYDELLLTVEEWAANARDAINTFACEGGEIHG